MEKCLNSLFTIFPYKLNGQWMFDDKSVGLIRESFIAGADTLLDQVAQGKDSLSIIFSGIKFPGWEVMIKKDSFKCSEVGTDYFTNEINNESYPKALLNKELWLCPSLLLYFDTPPDKIWVKFK